MSTIINQLRDAIDAKHAEALAALQTLQAYLDQTEHLKQPNRQNGVSSGSHSGVALPRHHGSIRERVLAAITDNWANCNEIANDLGLESKQVRGVVLAPDIRDSIQRREVGGVTEYRFERQKIAEE